MGMRMTRQRDAGFPAKVNAAHVAGLLACAVLTGCVVGPGTLERDYPRYSQAIRDIEDEHLLLNLVRMRYLETPVFLQISSISTTYGINVSASAAAANTSGSGSSTSGGVGGSYSETPTFTYSLPDSKEYFGAMVAPLSTAQLAPLAMSGAGGFLRMGLERINRLENVSSFSGWTNVVPPSYPEFDEALDLLEVLERDSLIDFTYNIVSRPASSPFDELGEHSSISAAEEVGIEFWKTEEGQWAARYGKRTPYLRFTGASPAADDPRLLRLRELLNLDPQKYSFPIVDVDFSLTEMIRIRGGQPAAAFDAEAKFGEIVIANRSMLEILGIASRSVQVPEEHLQAGLAAVNENTLGERLTIHSSKDEPSNAAIAAQHKGVWYYVAADDLNSKMTFLRLNSLIEVTAGRPAGAQPLLTIPVK